MVVFTVKVWVVAVGGRAGRVCWATSVMATGHQPPVTAAPCCYERLVRLTTP
ncbi:hypothetical protein [Streptomyces sp. NBC_01538]|uniref:hypothetical protein n=1 Tax=Streptomyces sp. NBC_01538 TaxID=2903897 RepID=UPI003870143B